jgi:hypothetical protein
MSKVKAILTSIERNKGKILKFFILGAVIKFFASTVYRIYSVKESRTQIETTINIYSLLVIGLVFLHEFLPCFLFKSITDNFKMITHYSGKGALFILISIIFMSHTLDTQQNYSAYLLFTVGCILICADCKFYVQEERSPFEIAMERSKNKAEQYVETLSVNIENPIEKNSSNNSAELTNVKPITVNPYDIPDDF